MESNHPSVGLPRLTGFEDRKCDSLAMLESVALGFAAWRRGGTVAVCLIHGRSETTDRLDYCSRAPLDLGAQGGGFLLSPEKRDSVMFARTMSNFFSRAFTAGRRTPEERRERLPPGQYVECGFSVLTAGPTPYIEPWHAPK